MEKKQIRNKTLKSKREEQQRDGEAGEKNKQTRRDDKIKQVGGTEKVEEKSKEVPLKDRKKRIIKNETYEDKSLIGINRGQGNKNKKNIEEKSFHTRDSWSSNQL